MSTFFSKLLTRMQPSGGPAGPEQADRDRHERDAFALRVRAILATVGIEA